MENAKFIQFYGKDVRRGLFDPRKTVVVNSLIVYMWVGGEKDGDGAGKSHILVAIAG